MKENKLCIWLFCRVIDNFGDIGVAWRLARQLVTEQNCDVVLWVDDWQAMQNLLPDVALESCVHQGVWLRFWHEAEQEFCLQKVPPADAVIETFACQLPEAVLAWMTLQDAVLWLNLEYLTAEDWVEGIHLLPSLQSNGVKKYFFCPGFSHKTGGLSYEAHLLSQQTIHQTDKSHLRCQHQLPEIADSLHVYVFGYADEIWPLWFEMWLRGNQKVTLWLAKGQVLSQLQNLYPNLQALQQVGQTVVCGKVTVCLVPFVAQAAFDEVLQAADVCVIRGEDSVLRALWQGQCFWWQIYRQEENAHHIKLKAFWQRFERDSEVLQDALAQRVYWAHQALSGELNDVALLSHAKRQEAWQLVCDNRLYLAEFLQKWRQLLWQSASLSTQLANFIRHQLK